MTDIENQIRQAMPLPVICIQKSDSGGKFIYGVTCDARAVPDAPDDAATVYIVFSASDDHDNPVVVDRKINNAACTMANYVTGQRTT